MARKIENYISERDEQRYPLVHIVRAVCELLRRGWDQKQELFQDDADDVAQFVDGGKDDFYSATYSRGKRGTMAAEGTGEESSQDVPVPMFQYHGLKVAEGLQLFVPSIAAQNPEVQITAVDFDEFSPEEMGMPALDQQRAQQAAAMGDFTEMQLIEHYQQLSALNQSKIQQNNAAGRVLEKLLNFYARAMNLRSHSRLILEDCFVSGMGVGETVLQRKKDRAPVIGTKYRNSRRLLLDPDAECDEEITWQAIMRIEPVWKVARKFKIKEDKLMRWAKEESQTSMAFNSGMEGKWLRKLGKTADLMIYWDWYSRMGIGDRIRRSSNQDQLKAYRKRGGYENAGLPSSLQKADNVYLAVCPDCPFPLNLHNDVLKKSDDDRFLAAQWALPFWEADLWPTSRLEFCKVPGKLYPRSHFYKGLPHIKWLNWAYSFLMNKVRTSCGTYIGVVKGAGEDIVEALKSGEDNKVFELEQILGTRITDLISFINQPAFQGDIWNVVEAVSREFEKATAMSDILYGTQGGGVDRSAEATRTRNENAGARIADMRSAYEAYHEELARKAAMTAAWLLEGKDVGPIVGPAGQVVFENVIDPKTMAEIASEYNIVVAPGSTTRKNNAAKLEDCKGLWQAQGAVLGQLALGGVNKPWNALAARTADAMGLQKSEWSEFMIPDPPPPEEMPPDPAVEAQREKVAGELQIMQQESQMKMQMHEMDMQMKAADLQVKREEMQMKTQALREKLAADRAKNAMQLQHNQQAASLDLAATQSKAEVDLAVGAQQAQMQTQVAANKANTEMQIANSRAANDERISTANAAHSMAIKEKENEEKAKHEPGRRSSPKSTSKKTAKK